MKILFLGDIFGENAIKAISMYLPKLIKKHKIDFVIAQAENASGRKGLIPSDYGELQKAGINAFTMGNHVWAKNDILKIIENDDIIRPFNVKDKYPGKGTRIFKVNGKTIRVTQFMGITFNQLNAPWKEKEASSFFDAFDFIEREMDKTDFHIIDFHGEVTSEKNLFGIYVDGKASALIGTHTHVQTADEKILPKGTAYITDAGMVGPINSVIGASYETIYQHTRYKTRIRFMPSPNKIEIRGVIMELQENNKSTSIKRISLQCK